MKKSLMKRWVKALRSGKYQQGKHLLKTQDSKYCCLGVLCELEGLSITTDVDALYQGSSLESYDGSLPKKYKAPNGLKYDDLTRLNDNGLSFKQIALIIERNYKEL